jgi:Tfp pilus assembly protein PilO|tara:strand:- start:193 stop:603 length:411 start_codon:yes stop_codon:yes gene_type:complete
MKISDKTSVDMPIKNLISIIVSVAVAVWAYFGLIETQNKHSTQLELYEKDIELNTEFRIKWPRGQAGSLPADQEQFLLIENLFKSVDTLEKNQEMNMTNKVNIEFLTKQLEKALKDIEKLKDANREIKYSNGNGTH